MDLEVYVGFVAACAALAALPGPNVGLIVANSIAYGRRYGFATVAGTTSAMIPQLAIFAAGMAAAMSLVTELLEWIRLAGILYLVWLAIGALRSGPGALTRAASEPPSLRSTIVRGFGVSLSNPKTLVFYGAFFPQFVAPDADPFGQMAILSATFLFIAFVVDSCWAALAGAARRPLAERGRLRNRLIAASYLAAAGALAVTR